MLFLASPPPFFFLRQGFLPAISREALVSASSMLELKVYIMKLFSSFENISPNYQTHVLMLTRQASHFLIKLGPLAFLDILKDLSI